MRLSIEPSDPAEEEAVSQIVQWQPLSPNSSPASGGDLGPGVVVSLPLPFEDSPLPRRIPSSPSADMEISNPDPPSPPGPSGPSSYRPARAQRQGHRLRTPYSQEESTPVTEETPIPPMLQPLGPLQLEDVSVDEGTIDMHVDGNVRLGLGILGLRQAIGHSLVNR